MDAANPSPESWYLYRDNQRMGPYTFNQMVEFWQQGRLSPADPVWCPSLNEWTPAGQLDWGQSPLPAVEPLPLPPQAAVQSAPQARETRQAQQKKRGCAPGVLVTTLVLAGLCVLVAGGYTAYKWWNARENRTELGGFIAGQEGGFTHEEISIVSLPGAEYAAVPVMVYRVEDESPALYDGTSAHSPKYTLDGELNRINGVLEITLPLSDSARQFLNDTGSNPAQLAVVLQEEGFSPSTNQEQPVVNRLPAAVDLAAGTITARMDFSGKPLGLAPASARLASPRERPRPQTLAEPVFRASVQVWSWEGWNYAESEHFLLSWHLLRGCDPDVVRQMANLLEIQLDFMENELGFSLAGRTSWPVEVYLFDINEWGFFSASKFSRNWSTMTFNAAYLRDPATYNQNLTELAVTAGHELFHLVQTLYNPQYSIQIAHPWAAKPYWWLDEAASTWYEPVSIGNPAYLPPNAAIHTNFVQTPLFFPKTEGRLPQDHGYGASLFLNYLTQKHGAGLVREIYEQARDHAQAQTGGEALEMALRARGSSVSSLWPEFLATYFLRPEQISPALSTASQYNQIRLTTQAKNEDVRLYFTDPKGKTRITASDGWWNKGQPPAAEVAYNLSNLSAEIFFLSLYADASSGGILDRPSILKISLTGSGDHTGALVYALSPGQNLNTAVPIAGPSKPLAFQAGGMLAVDVENFGIGQQYDRVAVIVFNNNPSYTEKTTEPAALLISYGVPTVQAALPTSGPPAQIDTDEIDWEDMLAALPVLAAQRRWPAPGGCGTSPEGYELCTELDSNTLKLVAVSRCMTDIGEFRENAIVTASVLGQGVVSSELSWYEDQPVTQTVVAGLPAWYIESENGTDLYVELENGYGFLVSYLNPLPEDPSCPISYPDEIYPVAEAFYQVLSERGLTR